MTSLHDIERYEKENAQMRAKSRRLINEGTAKAEMYIAWSRAELERSENTFIKCMLRRLKRIFIIKNQVS